MKSVIIISITLLFSGCASSLSHGGYGSGGTVISGDNYTMLGKVEGRAETPRLLFMKLSGGDVYNAAFDDLRINFSQKYGNYYSGNRGLINLTVDMQFETFILIPIFSRQVVIVTADVVEYNNTDKALDDNKITNKGEN